MTKLAQRFPHDADQTPAARAQDQQFDHFAERIDVASEEVRQDEAAPGSEHRPPSSQPSVELIGRHVLNDTVDQDQVEPEPRRPRRSSRRPEESDVGVAGQPELRLPPHVIRGVEDEQCCDLGRQQLSQESEPASEVEHARSPLGPQRGLQAGEVVGGLHAEDDMLFQSIPVRVPLIFNGGLTWPADVADAVP